MKPVFVYGTLMNGLSNYKRLLEKTTVEEFPATTKGIMYSVHDNFPAVVEGEGAIKGELIYIDHEMYDLVLHRLDVLEGYRESDPNSMYIRKETTVLNTQENIEVEAYIYIWNHETYKLEPIYSGDWKDHIKNIPSNYKGEWK